jgi:hypothetical protein
MTLAPKTAAPRHAASHALAMSTTMTEFANGSDHVLAFRA